MFQIGEFSKLTQVSVRMLRYYEKMGLLKPARTDVYTSYRYYDVEQIPVLHKIVLLRDLGYSVTEIREILAKWGSSDIHEYLKKKREDIERRVEEERQRLKRLEDVMQQAEEGADAIRYNVSLKQIPSYTVIALRRRIPTYFHEGELWKELAEFCGEQGVDFVKEHNTFSIYYDEDFREKDLDIEVCCPVSAMGQGRGDIIYRRTEEVSMAASAMVYGPFENIAGVYYTFARWLPQHMEYEMTGRTRQICHRGPWNEENQEKYLTEIIIELKEKKDA